MPPRRSPAQIRSQIRQAQSRARQSQQKLNQAIRNYNREVDKVNSARRKAVTDYNTAARKYNRSVAAFNREQRRRAAAARSNRARLETELRRLQRTPQQSTVRVDFRTSVETLASSVDVMTRRVDSPPWSGTDLLDLSEGEAANSVATLSALLDTEGATSDATDDDLQHSDLRASLDELDPEVGSRWGGALFALNPDNPDAARHFCTSAREMLSDVLEHLAPTASVEADDPSCERTDQGSVSRRARIRFCLRRSGLVDDDLESFVDEDIENVLGLFFEFNRGTHGRAGKFSLHQLAALKRRVEDALFFVLRIGTPSA